MFDGNDPNRDTEVINFPTYLRGEQREVVSSMLASTFPGQKTLLLDGGVSAGLLSQHEQLARIKAKLDALLKREST